MPEIFRNLPDGTEVSARMAILPVLEQLEIASPCTASWDDMPGNDRVRHCGSCGLDVFNLSGMTRREGRKLIADTNGKVCIRMFKRHDGTVLTQDCPTALAAARRRVFAAVALVMSLAGTAFAGVVATSFASRRPSTKSEIFKNSATINAMVNAFSGKTVVSHPPMVPTMGTPAPPPRMQPRVQAPRPAPGGPTLAAPMNVQGSSKP